MTTDFLTPNERSRLLDIFFDGSLTLEGAEKKFKELLPTARFAAASLEIKTIAKELIAASDGPAMITALYVTDVMRRSDCRAAKALLFDILVELEKAIRKDMFLQEQIKYSSKEIKENKKSVDAVHADELRVHCVAKVFAFDLLGGNVTGDTKASARMEMKQDAVDSALDVWEKTSIAIKEPLADITHCWTTDNEKQRCGAPLDHAAVFDQQPTKRAAVVMRTAAAKVPSLPVMSGELQLLLSANRPFFLFDGEAPSAEWEAAKKLLASAATSALSQDDQQTLLDVLSAAVVKRMDFSDKMVCEIAEHNPAVCAAIMTKLPLIVTSPRLQTLVSSNVAREKVGAVLLGAPKCMEQVNLLTFVTHAIKDLDGKASDKDAAKKFMQCLHQLVTKESVDNKELYIADALKSDLEKLVQSCETAEVTASWEEMKK